MSVVECIGAATNDGDDAQCTKSKCSRSWICSLLLANYERLLLTFGAPCNNVNRRHSKERPWEVLQGPDLRREPLPMQIPKLSKRREMGRRRRGRKSREREFCKFIPIVIQMRPASMYRKRSSGPAVVYAKNCDAAGPAILSFRGDQFSYTHTPKAFFVPSAQFIRSFLHPSVS